MFTIEERKELVQAMTEAVVVNSDKEQAEFWEELVSLSYDLENDKVFKRLIKYFIIIMGVGEEEVLKGFWSRS